jgi:hypothetical protein
MTARARASPLKQVVGEKCHVSAKGFLLQFCHGGLRVWRDRRNGLCECKRAVEQQNKRKNDKD